LPQCIIVGSPLWLIAKCWTLVYVHLP
jgi:hypothetical protein